MLSELEKIEPPTRRALFAIEVIDSVSGSTLYDRIKVEPLDASGKVINGPPIINHSGKFVWLEPRNDWPAKVRVRPDDRPNPPPFEVAVIDTPRPANPIPARKRLFTVLLRPTRAYAFGDGVTAVRGNIWEGDANNRRSVRGAIVQLALAIHGSAVHWWPDFPGENHIPAIGEALTNDDGDFVVFAQVPPPVAIAPDIKAGLLKIRLQIVRPGQPERMQVPVDGWFPEVKNTRIPVGRLYSRNVSLEWNPNE